MLVSFSVASRFSKSDLKELRYWLVLTLAASGIPDVPREQLRMSDDRTVVRQFEDGRILRFRINPSTLGIDSAEGDQEPIWTPHKQLIERMREALEGFVTS